MINKRTIAVCISRVYAVASQILPFGLCKRVEIFADRKLLKKDDYLHPFFIKHHKGQIRYCIFRYKLPEINILSTGVEYLFYYDFCRRKKVIPLLDLEYEWFYKENQLGECNLWELVFQQKIRVKDAVQTENVFVDRTGGSFVYSVKACKEINGTWHDHRIYTTKNNWRAYYRKAHKYIRHCWKLRDDVKAQCDRFFSEHFSREDRILGIMLREDFSVEFNRKLTGADKELYERHPLNPDVKEIIGTVKRRIAEWGCNKIFLATMYEESAELFREEFGGIVVMTDRERRPLNLAEDKRRRKADMSIQENYDLFRNNRAYFEQETLAYIMEVITLSRCRYYIAPHCSGSAAVLAFNGGRFRDIEVLENSRNVKGY